MFNKQDIVDKDKATKAKEQTFLAIVIGLIIVIILSLIIVLTLTMNTTHRISLPPTLEFGKIVNTGEIDPFEVYSLAGTITQQLNSWQNGEQDFKKNINKFSAYITPAYRAYLLDEYNNLLKLGELSGRERSLQEEDLYQASHVKKQANGWLVSIVFRQQEHINNQRFKNFRIKRFIKVVYRNINTEQNPWGLQLDTPLRRPVRLKDKDLRVRLEAVQW